MYVTGSFDREGDLGLFFEVQIQGSLPYCALLQSAENVVVVGVAYHHLHYGCACKGKLGRRESTIILVKKKLDGKAISFYIILSVVHLGELYIC